MVRFENVVKTYESQEALSGVTFQAARGELLFLTGASGAGKSTLLKLIYRAIEPDGGSIIVNGIDTGSMKAGHIPGLRRNIGVVFQDFRLLSGRTVYDNVALALRIRGMAERAIKNQVMEVLKMVGLRHKADCWPETVSGGEQQRAVIARAIVAEPVLLLADEPTGNLDTRTGQELFDLLSRLNAQKGITFVIATHDKDLSGRCKRVISLVDGKIV